MRRAQFFEIFEYSDNLLIINFLHLNQLFLSPDTTLESLIFKFLFRHFSKAVDYTFLNISPCSHCLLS